jgi:hypothetical protein
MKHSDLLKKGAKREGCRNVQGEVLLSLGATLEGGEDMNVYWQIGLSLGATFKRGRALKCPRSDKSVTGSNIQERKRHQNVHLQIGQIGLSLGATFKRGKDTKMSKGGKDCHWKQPSKEEKTPKCPLEHRAVVGGNVEKRKGD